jgi:hypothetical protein
MNHMIAPNVDVSIPLVLAVSSGVGFVNANIEKMVASAGRRTIIVIISGSVFGAPPRDYGSLS